MKGGKNIADIDARRYTTVKVIPLKEGSVIVAYGNYSTDPRWHLLFECQSKAFDTFAQIFEYCNTRFRNPFGGVSQCRCFDVCDKKGEKEVEA